MSPFPARTATRPTLLGVGAVVGFLLAAVVAAGLTHAGTADAAAARVHTRLKVSWGDTTPVAGDKVLVHGSASPGRPGRLLRVQTPTRTGHRWRTVGSVRTSSHGSFAVYLQHTIGGGHRYRVLALATSRATAAVSRTVGFHVTRRPTTVAAHLSTSTAARNAAVTVSGVVGSDFTARTVLVQRRARGAASWRTVGRSSLNAVPTYSLPMSTTTPGAWEYRATVSATKYARTGHSPVLALTVE